MDFFYVVIVVGIICVLCAVSSCASSAYTIIFGRKVEPEKKSDSDKKSGAEKNGFDPNIAKDKQNSNFYFHKL